VIVRVKDEPARIDALQQDGADRRPALARRGGQRHGRRVLFGGPRLFEPGRELGERIGVGVRFVERLAGVFPPDIAQRHSW